MREIGGIVGDYQLVHADVETLPCHVAAGSVALILTDPPYHHAMVRLYGVLAHVAAQVLQPGGSLVAMCGQSYLPEILALMTPHLRYQWLLAARLSGPGTAVWQRRVQNYWRALLWFVHGPYTSGFQGDFLRSDGPDKRFHAWGQSIVDFAALITRFSAPGDLICDPFVGGGTVGKAAVLLGRRFVGLDCDATALAHTARRLRRVSAADVVQSPLELVESPLRLRPWQRCRREFPTQHPTGAYCSPACRQAAYRARMRRVTVA
jgi:hypothetical protein